MQGYGRDGNERISAPEKRISATDNAAAMGNRSSDEDDGGHDDTIRPGHPVHGPSLYPNPNSNPNPNPNPNPNSKSNPSSNRHPNLNPNPKPNPSLDPNSNPNPNLRPNPSPDPRYRSSSKHPNPNPNPHSESSPILDPNLNLVSTLNPNPGLVPGAGLAHAGGDRAPTHPVLKTQWINEVGQLGSDDALHMTSSLSQITFVASGVVGTLFVLVGIMACIHTNHTGPIQNNQSRISRDYDCTEDEVGFIY